MGEPEKGHFKVGAEVTPLRALDFGGPIAGLLDLGVKLD